MRAQKHSEHSAGIREDKLDRCDVLGVYSTQFQCAQHELSRTLVEDLRECLGCKVLQHHLARDRCAARVRPGISTPCLLSDLFQ